MIPIKLRIRNFMCYRDNVPPLYFEGIHIACICGDNGNGKSALIDAITWALWGRTRAKSDDDLIHSGQTETEVEFDFAVGEQVYRIIRKHSRPKRRQASGQSSLDLLIASGDSFKVISGDGIRQTEQKIKDTLHMDYDTFTNSAFLRQGNADQFTRQTPNKRKEVLANILGLSLYDELEEQAREQAREQETEKTQLESAIKDITDELAQKPAYQTELVQVQAELSRIEKIIAEQQSRLNDLRAAKEALGKKQVQLNQAEEHITGTERDLERWNEQIEQHRSRLKEYEELIAQRLGIEEGYTRLTQGRELNAELEQKLRQSAALNQYRHQLEMTVQQAQASLITEHKLAQSRAAELETRFQKQPQFKTDLQQIQRQLPQLDGEEEILRGERQSCQELRTHVHQMESASAQLEREIAEIQAKLNLLLTETEARCPLCERELEEEGLKLIETKYTADGEQKRALLEGNQAELKEQKLKLEARENEVSRRETALSQQRATVQGKASILSQQIAEAEEAGRQLNEERQGLTGIEERLARKDFSTTEQEALKDIGRELAELDYNSEQHEQLRLQLASLEQYADSKRRLDEADRLINQEKESIATAEKNSRELLRSLEADYRKKQELAAELTSMPQLVSDLTQAEAEHQTLSIEQKQTTEIMWGVKAKLQRCQELEEKNKEKGELLAKAAREQQIYRELAQAFGKGGIQAMIIEIALPEIEIEANKLLARMTDNRMQVKIETQRETKKGNVLETLDINISDELGTRNYEMFSGGEAFRINFATRIALSKLLARRAGAPLPTLIIDEGFGTQDSTGLEKLKEAINSIQDDFDKILVITHIEELKDAFPARIDVIKTADGSTLEVS